MLLIILILAIDQQSTVGVSLLVVRSLWSRRHGLGIVVKDIHFVFVDHDDDVDSGGGVAVDDGDGRKYSGYWDTLVWGARWGPRP